jgi:hypothetical protein
MANSSAVCLPFSFSLLLMMGILVLSWTRQYTVLLHSVMSTAFGAKQPSYSVIISLDRKIRDFPIPVHWRPVSDDTEGPAPAVSVELNMQRWMCMSMKETSMSQYLACSSIQLVLMALNRSAFESAPTIFYTGIEGYANGFSTTSIYTLCNSHL